MNAGEFMIVAFLGLGWVASILYTLFGGDGESTIPAPEESTTKQNKK